MKKKGMFFSTDALVALIIIVLSILVIYPIMKYSIHESSIPGDTLRVLSSLKIGEINNSYIQELISNNSITDLNKSVLEQIGEFYATDSLLAKSLAEIALSYIDTKENLGIWYGDTLLASKNSTSFEDAKNIDSSSQTISGIEKGKALNGFIAKAWLKNIVEKESSSILKGDVICGGWKTYSWGEYCGSTENFIVYQLNIPENATIEDVSWLFEGSWVNQYTNLSVNDAKIFNNNINYYQIFNITSKVIPGENNLTIDSPTGGDDGASHIVVKFTVPEMETYVHQSIFPFNYVKASPVLHYEKSVFIPSEIFNITLKVNTTSDVTLSIRKGATKIQVGKKTPTSNSVEFSSSEIEGNLSLSNLSYSNLSNEYFFLIVDIGKDSHGANVILDENSYAEIESSDIPIPFGSIDVTLPISINQSLNNLQHTFYSYLVWKFFMPSEAIPIIADWQLGWLSMSSDSNQKASANGITLYEHPPDSFIEAFSRFGYTPSRASGLFKEGENNFTLEFGNNYGVSNEASYGYLTYFIKSFVNYGEAKEKAKGGTKNIEFEDGSSGSITIGDPGDSWDPDKDAIDEAVDRLLHQLDFNNNNKIDLTIDESSFEIESMDISGVPYIWSTEVQARTWG